MRLLFLSNFYPQASRGGFEQWCQEVAEGLRNRGHSVQVLTSEHGRGRTEDPNWVHRDLHLEMEIGTLRNAFQFFTHRRRRERENLVRTRSLVESFQPDAALIWGMWNLQHSIPALVEKKLGSRVAYYMGDYWPTLPNPFEDYWNAPARNVMTGIPKALLKPLAQAILARATRPSLRFEHILFPSKFMMDEFAAKNITANHARVIYGAIDTDLYLQDHIKSNADKEEIFLLFVGRLSEEKGVHITIRALGLLARNHGFQNIRLTIVGNGELGYVSFLHDLAKKEGVAHLIQFMDAQPKEALPAIYHKADIFLFPSIWAEPFGRVLVEAMASGVPVVGAQVGGASEILSAGQNALTFTTNDSADFAEQLKRLIENPGLRDKLGKAGRDTAISRFSLQRMTAEIESYLQAVVGHN